MSSVAAGMMFLFPHVLQVVTAAESCGTTEGAIEVDKWYVRLVFTNKFILC